MTSSSCSPRSRFADGIHNSAAIPLDSIAENTQNNHNNLIHYKQNNKNNNNPNL